MTLEELNAIWLKDMEEWVFNMYPWEQPRDADMIVYRAMNQGRDPSYFGCTSWRDVIRLYEEMDRSF